MMRYSVILFCMTIVKVCVSSVLSEVFDINGDYYI